MIARLRRIDFGLLYAVQMLSAISMSTMVSLLPAVGRSAHISDPLIVSVQALSAGSWILVSGFWARLAQRRGRKLVILAGAIGLSVGSVATGVAIWIAVLNLVPPMMALLMITFARTANGAIGIASTPASQAFVVERTSAARRTVALSSLASAQALGTIVGPAAAPFLTHIPGLGLAGPMLIIGAVGVLMVPLVAFILPHDRLVDTRATEPTDEVEVIERLWRIKPIRDYLIYSTILTISSIGGIQTIGFLVIDTVLLPPDDAQRWVGLAMATGAAATLAVQLGLIPLLKPSSGTLMVVAPVVALVGLLMMAILPSYALVVVATIVMSMGVAAGRPAVSSAASFALPAARQTEVAAIMLSTASVGFIVGPILAVTLYTVWKPLPFLFLAAMQCGAFAIALRHRHALKRDRAA